MNLIRGRVWKYGDDINTDVIFPGKYVYTVSDPSKMAVHALEDLDPKFASEVRPGDIVVAGKNWGCGSSREQAPLAIKYAGAHAVLAKSFARIFYRNSFNLGLPLVECDTGKIKNGDSVRVDLEKGKVESRLKGYSLEIKPFNKFQNLLIKEGGIVNLYKKHGGLNIVT